MIDHAKTLPVLLLGALLAASAGGCGSTSNADGSADNASLTGGSGGDDAQASGGGESDGAGGGGESGGQGGSGTGGVQLSGGAGGGGGADGAGGVEGMVGSTNVCTGAPSLLVGEQICRGHEDCQGGYCSRTPETGGCGACTGPFQECQDDESCGAGMICENLPSTIPCSCSGWDARCVADCTTAGCGEDFRSE